MVFTKNPEALETWNKTGHDDVFMCEMMALFATELLNTKEEEVEALKKDADKWVVKGLKRK